MRSARAALASRLAAGVALLIVAGALPWLSQRDPAASILRARYAELEPTPDALASIRTELGLDGGPIATSVRWWSGVLSGDLGASWVSGAPVAPGAWAAFGVSLTLAGFAIGVAAVIAVGLVAPACVRVWRDRPIRGAGPVGVALTAMPEFLLASGLLIVLAVQLRLFPPFGWQGLEHVLLPALALGIPGGGLMGRLVVDAIAGAGNERWAVIWRAGGAPRGVVLRGVLRRAGAAVVDQVALVLIGVLGGAVAVEQVFAIPGLGRYLLGAANAQDLPALQAGVLLIAAAAIAAGAVAGGARLLLWGGPLPEGAIAPPPEHRPTDRATRATLITAAGLLLVIVAAGIVRDPYASAHPRLAPPSWALPFGADASGRDLLARVAHGVTGTLGPALLIVVASIVLGLVVAFGGAGSAGPVEVANATPPILAGVIVAALAGPTAGGAALAVLWVSWPPLAAHARSLLAEARAMPYVRWLPVVGTPRLVTTFRHIVPTVLPPLVRHAVLRLPGIALALASLGFLGLGAQPPTPEWGLLLAEGIDYVERAPWTTVAPGSALILVSIIAVASAGAGLGSRRRRTAPARPAG
ncbi:ABC transporter permease subunit [Microbacterium sp. SORGH_AS_0888]|uniref:ABC transporter permease subunit n=1 Tax=Microbacterium sp. SORGH_AS_0888 TaxID=3041791 RepID=UPI0027857CAB|nr:ABC transporter permease subunit [Microbacterium sp. SORGH_AS_0888]MDQ1128215.1 peptide/nickel transport system permease protein [Microbacterium sp. SORGH_AS_0888]